MATSSSSSFDFTIVLFNCRPRMESYPDPKTGKPSKKPVMNEDTRQKCETQVLESLQISDDCNLFLLVQGAISGPTHRIISEYVSTHTAYAVGPYNEKAGVYSFSGSHGILSFNRKYLERVSEQMTPAPSRYFSVKHLTACVITQESTRAKMLLVSWHGPRKPSEFDRIKCFHNLIDFLEKLQCQMGCSSVMICGGFNLSANYAKCIITEKQLNGVVCDDYEVPPFRHNVPDKIDYIVRWPARYYNQPDAPEVIDPPDFEARNGEHEENPFDHPIIKFRFTAEYDDEEGLVEEEGTPDSETDFEGWEEYEDEEGLEKDERIEELETELAEQEERHSSEILEKEECITALETKLEEKTEYEDEEGLEKDERIEELETELAEQEERHREEVKEKDERITALEAQLGKKDKQIEDLETRMQQQLSMDSTKRTTDSSPLPGSEEPEPR